MFIDTFSTFLRHWNGSKESWLRYIQEYPELFEKIKWDYERYETDWREYLKLLTKRTTEELNLAHGALLEVLPGVEQRIKRLFKVEGYNVVIYVGLENGAGWVTEFMGRPSILFGLEAIAELNWYDRLEGLVAHEFGHLVHWVLRGEDIEKFEDEGMMWLYTEGFAQRVEDIVTGRPWHLEYDGWFEWCTRNERRIKEEFSRRIRENEPLNPFFGSWYELFGMKFTGYYLGYRFIRWLEETLSFEEIAKLKKERVRGMILEFLEG
ncbi:hypothetical protein [Thermococcus sp. 21S7]|uniref:hypothetical protein n=1 Tax=Thermococcus sp. 21S7 TaxID=1638221 RepID=UPI00143ABD6D|nr:hypothetical protein [Thermococcus sp. 21S7]NJE61103.1 hypothetical protein [Thermococcus sp. 21S7]